MEKKFTILIADRNPHVRKFLKRELASEGYRIRIAENATEVLKRANHAESLDLIIIDPDSFHEDRTTLLKRLQNRIPILPIVIHSFQSDDNPYPVDSRHIIFVEKREDSIELLKKIAMKYFRNNRFIQIN